MKMEERKTEYKLLDLLEAKEIKHGQTEKNFSHKSRKGNHAIWSWNLDK